MVDDFVPRMLLLGFLMHPDLLSFARTTTAQQLAANFRHSELFHIGHLIVTLAVPLIIAALLGVMARFAGQGHLVRLHRRYSRHLWRFILAVDKGSLCLVLSAFDTLPDAQFAQLVPLLQVMVDRAGLLWLNWLLVLLPLGAIIQAIGLIKEKQLATWQGISMIVGLLLLNNPDIELISSVGAVLMMVGYVPLSIKILKSDATAKSQKSASATAGHAL
ncbi:MAG: hypothetical protein R3E79_07295 [Caldilineaceae bacterium]